MSNRNFITLHIKIVKIPGFLLKIQGLGKIRTPGFLRLDCQIPGFLAPLLIYGYIISFQLK